MQLLTVFLLIALSGIPAAAESGASVATIGSKKYDSLAAAIKKVKNNETIVLEKSVICDQNLQLNANKKYTINFNNKTLTLKRGTSLLVKKGKVTFAKARITHEDTKGTILTVSKGVTLNIGNGTYKGKISNAGVLNISGGQFASLEEKTDLESTLIMNKGTMTVSGGTFDGTQCLLNGTGATLTVKEGKKGCKFSSKCFCTLLNFGTATLEGGTYISKQDWPIIWTEGPETVAKTTVKNGTFTSEWTMLESYGEARVTVSGGKFTSKAPKQSDIAMLLAFSGNINVTGGTFKAKNIGLYGSDAKGKVTVAENVQNAAKTKGKEVTIQHLE